MVACVCVCICVVKVSNVSCYDALCRLNQLWLRMLRFGMLRDVTGTNKLDGTVTVLGILERS